MKFKKRNIQIVDHSTGQTLDFPTFGKQAGEEAINELEQNVDNKIAELKSLVGTPLKASTASAMNNRDKIYVYTGNETGYTNGHWYYYDGTNWSDGGVYNSSAVNTDKTLSMEDMPADAKKTGDEISELKEDFATMESDGVVPSAEQILTDKGVTDSVPYHFRRTGGNGADRLYDQIVGGTVCWNQLLQNGNFADGATGWTPYMATATYDNNIATIVTANSVDVNSGGSLYQSENSILVNHKYIVSATVKGDGEHRVALRADGGLIFDTITNISNDFKTFVGVAAGDSGYSSGRVVITAYGPSVTVYLKNVVLFDLTAMFGSTIADYIYSLEQTTAGAGVAFFKALFPNDYYPYNAGELVSVSGLSEHKMTGFNQWDEEVQTGRWSNTVGSACTFVTDSTRYCNKTPIRVLPNSTYYVKTPNVLIIMLCDADMNVLSVVNTAQGNSFTTQSNCAYICFYPYSTGLTYNHGICINLSDPAKNGTYEPYESHSYPLDDSLTLRGIPTLVDGKIKWDGDVYTADGKVTRRYGTVDLGTLVWGLVNGQTDVFSTSIADLRPCENMYVPNAFMNRYVSVKGNDLGKGDKEFTAGINRINTLMIKDSAYTDAATFKTAMSGVYLVYELATPTTENADPYQHLQQCDPNGTEEYVSTGIVPVGHNSFYPENLRAKVEQLPWNFANLIAPTESTYTATRNYTTGSLFIVNNVLYKATSNIANGGTITPNTNCTATTLAEIISALA